MTDQLRPSSSSSSSSPASPSTAISSAPALCTNHCGFYGSAKQDGMCSKCFKIVALKKAAEAAAATASPSTPSSSSAASSSSDLSAAAASPAAVSVSSSADVLSEDIPIFRSSVSASSLPPLSFSDSLTIPLTSPAASPQLPAAPAPSPQPSTTPAAIDLASSSSSTTTLSPPLSSLSLAAVSPSPAPLALLPTAAAATAAAATAAAAVAPASSSDKKRKNRCLQCNIKVGLTFFSCRCNDQAMFCSAHRYPHSHNCTVDQRKQQTEKLTKANPVCAHDKLERI